MFRFELRYSLFFSYITKDLQIILDGNMSIFMCVCKKKTQSQTDQHN